LGWSSRFKPASLAINYTIKGAVMVDTAVAPAQSLIPPGPLFAVDEKTRRTVKVTFACRNWLLAATQVAAILGFVVSMAYSWDWGANPVFMAVILAIFWLFVWGLEIILLFGLIVNPIQRALFAASARRIDRAMVGLPLRFSLAAFWSSPAPGGVGVDPARRILFLVCEGTGYHMLFLRPHHILSAKIERSTTLHTDTRFSGSWGGVYGHGLMGGHFSGSAKSTTTATDNIFLEVQFRLNEYEAPRYVALPYGAQRQWAESWLIAINELRR
jgi:hypothetical protein